jgi:hypothetical protein
MRELLRKLFGRRSAPVLDEAGAADDRAWFESPEDLEWFFPPNTVTDSAAWDRYWHDQVSHGVGGFVHLFVHDGELVDAMRVNGLRTVLCVGNGISQEPKALAWAGFDVTSLDISPLAAKVASAAVPPDDLLAELVGGRSGGLSGCSEFVVGDLCDPACCPGPYDVVIERKTLQLWPDAERPMAIQAVANRLASRGIFFSHSHDGGWQPPAPRRHALEPWFVSQGWEFWGEERPLTRRVAWLLTTTG